MSSRNKSIEAQTIAKAMITYGYDPEDSKTITVADFWMDWIGSQAGPEDSNSGGYSSQPSTPARGGGASPQSGSFEVAQIDDKGNYVRASIVTPEGRKWASAWDKDAGVLRACREGDRIEARLDASKCGKYLNIKDSKKVEEIPF